MGMRSWMYRRLWVRYDMAVGIMMIGYDNEENEDDDEENEKEDDDDDYDWSR